MKELFASLFLQVPYYFLRNYVLEMGVDPTVGDHLHGLDNGLDERIVCKLSIVCMVMLYCHAFLSSVGFKHSFGFDYIC